MSWIRIIGYDFILGFTNRDAEKALKWKIKRLNFDLISLLDSGRSLGGAG